MSRTTVYKAAYFSEVAAVAALSLWVLVHFRFSLIAGALLIACLLIPGRVLGFFWRDLLRGLRLLNAGEFSESKRHSELFLATVRQKPWLKKLVWLGSSSYSRDPEALALNNLAAAEVRLGELEAAKTHLEASMALDRKNPLPAWNMGVLHRAIGKHDQAVAWFQEAARLGYSRSASDRIVMSSQTRFADLDGSGHS